MTGDPLDIDVIHEPGCNDRCRPGEHYLLGSVDGGASRSSGPDSADTVSLTDFVHARIAEDEAAAIQAADDGTGADRNDDWETSGTQAACGCCEFVSGLGVALDDRQSGHVARWDPARVLAECKAKRTLIEGHAPYSYHADGPFSPMSEACLACDAAWPCITLRAFADVYADHADYLPEWA